MPYPTGTDLGNYLIKAGVISALPVDMTELNDIATATWQGWEQDTLWIPFLGTSNTLTFNAPQGKTYYPSKGIIAVTSFVIDSVTLVAGTDYWLGDQLPDGPYQSVELLGRHWGGHNNMVINAVFGYTNTLPVLIFRALLQKGKYNYLYTRDESTGAVVKEKQGPVEFTYAASTRSSQMSLTDDGSGQYPLYSDQVGHFRRKAFFGCDPQSESWSSPFWRYPDGP